MAKQLYGYNRAAYGGAPPPSAAAAAATGYSSRTAAVEPYLPSDTYSSRYFPSSFSDPLSSDYSSMYKNYSSSAAAAVSADLGSYSASRIPSSSHFTSWPGVVDASVGLKRSSEALYHQTILGAHNTIGQNDWLSTSYLAKRPRYESASTVPIYPQRPGEKDCAHYMLTRTCKFGESCKFDHPIWVPEGGIPDWKEVPLNAPAELLPERPGQLDCPYFLKTQRCKFGPKCKFNHPKSQVASLDAVGTLDGTALPDRPSEPPCAFYMKTGICKFGATCKFHHPKDIMIPSAEQENGTGEKTEPGVMSLGLAGDPKPTISVTPALLHNTKGLPMRPGEVDCPFYLKTGSCKYGASCRYNHPERTAIYPPVAGISHAFVASPAATLTNGVINSAVSALQTVDPRLPPSTLGFGASVYPQRPGQGECDFYMKTGECKFAEKCKFHHPLDRSVPVKLTLAGFPRREGAAICPYYMKTSTCKYGATCKFDHPPPGEVMAMATSQVTSTTEGREGKGDE